MVDLTGMAYSALPNAFKYRQGAGAELRLPSAAVVGRRARAPSRLRRGIT